MNSFISLKVKCPKCGKSLIDPGKKIDDIPGIKLLIKTEKKSGNIWLSALYGSYNLECDIPIEKDEIAVFSCPFCHEEVTSIETCETCNAPMATILLDMGGKINFCTRKGCKKHSAEFEDLSLALKKLYEDYDSYSS
jgi:hypothetical protein